MYTATRQKVKNSVYWDAKAFEADCKFLQEGAWIFAGMTHDVPNNNDYITLTIAGHPITIQNFGGTLKAFDNICSHRHCLIRKEEKGRGALRCPYHSWSYDKTGVPVSIPAADEAFGLDDSARHALRLREWRLELCGSFIFVCGGDKLPNLADQLGGYFDKLVEVSDSLGPEVDCLVSVYDANWKICVENTLDEYHANFVHPTTFRTMLSGEFYYDYNGLGSDMRAPAVAEYLKKWSKVERLLGPRPIVSSDYFHYHIFPTMTVASSFGASFSIQQFTPLSPTSTRLTSRLFFAKSKASENIISSLSESAKSFNQTVFEEDRVICNMVQEGVAHSRKTGTIGKYEQRISHFQESMLKCLPAEIYLADA